jgi:mannose-6-phosphate isomerase-like protein (cupin superfamily)
VTDEARIEDVATGRQPAGAGWFILNAAEMGWSTVEGGGGGIWNGFESPHARPPMLGIGIHILYPGDRPGWYHAEQEQEGFLVLSGECLALVEGQERRMGAWDYLHCPPGTAHILVGAGEGPCAILMAGTRTGGDITYLPDPVAARHGAAVERESHSPREVYAGRPPIVPARSPWPLPGA